MKDATFVVVGESLNTFIPGSSSIITGIRTATKKNFSEGMCAGTKDYGLSSAVDLTSNAVGCSIM